MRNERKLRLMGRRLACRLLVAAAYLAGAGSTVALAADWSFRVHFPAETREAAFTGRAYLFFSRKLEQPRFGPNWFNPEPFLALDVEDVKPGEAIEFSLPATPPALGFPDGSLDPAEYRVQAVLRFNPWERKVGRGPGNGYSASAVLPQHPPAEPVALTVSEIVRGREFQPTRWSKELVVPSRLLTAFYERETALRAAVHLPASYYDEPERRYPTIFIVPGFGGTHHGVRKEPRTAVGDVEFLQVVLDPSCPLGHHVFADSANNGPVGEALLTELIPAYERQFRGVRDPGARFLTGHSSGGWSTLWLQITYPEAFAGVWSTAPDPVDFRDFQQVDIYEPQGNVYRDAEGRLRPLVRLNGEVKVLFQTFAEMEHVLGPGGQLHSFEAVFSPRGGDGKPQLLWDRETGAIDPAVAEAWRQYDIRLIVERKWERLAPHLAGKLHVFMGDKDNFYLTGATLKLKAALERVGSDAVVEIHPGKDHFTLMTAELRGRIQREMAAMYREFAGQSTGAK